MIYIYSLVLILKQLIASDDKLRSGVEQLKLKMSLVVSSNKKQGRELLIWQFENKNKIDFFVLFELFQSKPVKL